MKRLLRRVLGKRAVKRPAAARRIGLRDVHSDDTFIVSFPRSGNTWVRFLIAAMCHPGEEISFRNIERYVPDIHKSRGSIRFLARPRFIKSHTPCFDAFPRFVYVLRDGRDAMISYYHYALGRKSFRGSLRAFVESEGAARYGTWSAHAMGALKRAEEHADDVLLVRYEDLVFCPLDQASRIEDFCRPGVRPEVIEQAVLDSRFPSLQEIERRHGGELDELTELRFFRSRETLSILGYAK